MLTEVIWKWLDTIDIVVTDRVLTSGTGGMPWILLQLLLHTLVAAIGAGGMSWILLQLLLHTVVSTIGNGGIT